jgi:enamine deaminase RidA (YjgF/YER057c/UK114 family)
MVAICVGLPKSIRWRPATGKARRPAVRTGANLEASRTEPLEPDMRQIKILNPDSLGKRLGQYSQLTRVKASEFLFIAGADQDGKASPDFEAQCSQVFANIGAALSSQGAGFANIVEFTTYLVHSQDIPKFMQYRSREFPGCSPAAPIRPTPF